jgi:hypothetical protein
MRFFGGGRMGGGDGKKKLTAGDRYKLALKEKEMAAKGIRTEKTQDEKYKEMMEARIAKMTEDALMGRKKNAFRMPGTKEEAPKEVSKNAKLMLQILAMQKIRKEQKAMKKKEKEAQWAASAKKRAAYLAKQQKDADAYQKKLEEEAAAAAAAATTTSSWWGIGPPASSDDNGWW